jgi:hypothetical protein
MHDPDASAAQPPRYWPTLQAEVSRVAQERQLTPDWYTLGAWHEQ